MPVVAIFSGPYCGAEPIVQEVASRLDAPVVERELLERASGTHGVPVEQLVAALGGKPSFWDRVTHQRAAGLVRVRAALADLLQKESLVLVGPATLLVPPAITHTLKVSLRSSLERRVERAAEMDRLSARQARRQIQDTDAQLGTWARELLDIDPWDSAHYDLIIPTDTVDPAEATNLIADAALAPALRPTPESMRAVLDASLAARVNLALLEAGHHYCAVTVERGAARIVVNKEVLRLEPLARELEQVARGVDGVTGADTRVGPGYNRPDIITRQEFNLPPRALLVDDEEEFVLTLSERLEMRDLPTDVVFGGREALDRLDRQAEQPVDVMVLDLRMPGMGGMEVLREVKQRHPKVEVIVLTGHGSDQDRDEALSSGAFAFLRKPVAIGELAETVQRARERAMKPTDDPQQ